MKTESRVIRTVEGLGLSEHALKIAQKLLEQIDRPVVFLVDSEGDKNYAHRHPLYSNQHWVTVKQQKQRSEYERLILAGIYRGLRDRRRYYNIAAKIDYQNIVANYKDIKRQNIAYGLPNKINSFVSTLSAEFFLIPNDVETSEEVRDWQFCDRMKRLHDYLKKQRTIGLRWYREVEIANLLDYGNLCRLKERYKDQILKLVRQIIPPATACRYLGQIKQLSDGIVEVRQGYTLESAEKVEAKLYDLILNTLCLHGWFEVRPFDVQGDAKFPMPNHEMAEHYTFVPEDIDHEDIIVKGIRFAREMVMLILEYDTEEHEKIPNVVIDLILHESFGAFANKGEHEVYCVSMTTGLFTQIYQHINEISIGKNTIDMFKIDFDEQKMRDRLFKYAVFFVTAHEYAHIYHGDCKNESASNPEEKKKRETAADQKAMEWLVKLVAFQPEYHDAGKDDVEMFGRRATLDMKLACEAAKICRMTHWI